MACGPRAEFVEQAGSRSFAAARDLSNAGLCFLSSGVAPNPPSQKATPGSTGVLELINEVERTGSTGSSDSAVPINVTHRSEKPEVGRTERDHAWLHAISSVQLPAPGSFSSGRQRLLRRLRTQLTRNGRTSGRCRGAGGLLRGAPAMPLPDIGKILFPMTTSASSAPVANFRQTGR